MYYPYLYGKQMELLALRDVASEMHEWGNVTPMIEPVNLNAGDLGRCLQVLRENRVAAYVILNSNQGEFREGNPEGWRNTIMPYIDEADSTYPAHQISTAADAATLSLFVDQYAKRRVGIVLRAPVISAQDLSSAVRSCDATVFVHVSANPRAYVRDLPAGRCVEVMPSFNVQERNADYLGSEWFSSSHLDFAAEGRPGFSDFGPLPTAPSKGGGPPGAVAIHLTYFADDGSLWVQHFVSDSTEIGDGDAASKIAEAAAKVSTERESNPGKFIETSALQAYLAQSVTGLGTNKRQQIVHHLETAARSFEALEVSGAE